MTDKPQTPDLTITQELEVNILKCFGLVIITAGLMGCVDPNTFEASTTPISSASEVNRAQQLVAERMRDPEATRFKPEYQAYRTNVGDIIVCGTLNAKNAMGGYVGYKPYYVRIRNGIIQVFNTVSESDEYNFELNTVQTGCSDAATGTIMVMS
jgi:hypothetical protein